MDKKDAEKFYIIDYKCKHCGMGKGEHKANTFNCMIKTKYKKFAHFYEDMFYEEDLSKPIKTKFIL